MGDRALAMRCTIAIPIEYDRGESEDGPHAVRWARRELRRMVDMDWTRWHYSSDSTWTACGVIVGIGLAGTAVPETANVSKVDCKRCLKAMNDSVKTARDLGLITADGVARWEDEGGAVSE